MPIVAIGLGANLGDRADNLRIALKLLAERFAVSAVSSIYETEPMYVSGQPAFLNAAALVEGTVGPLALLQYLKDIERRIGRTPRERFGPREIDLDLLAYGALSYVFSKGDERVLQVPHPSIPERRFVLAPLAEIAPNLQLPGMGTVQGLLAATQGRAGLVRRIRDARLSVPN